MLRCSFNHFVKWIILFVLICIVSGMYVKQPPKSYLLKYASGQCPKPIDCPKEPLQPQNNTDSFPNPSINCNCTLRGVNNIKNVAKDCSSYWIKLDLSLNDMKYLVSNAFKDSFCNNVLELKLCIAGLQNHIVAFAFVGLNKLETLNLSYNKIQGFENQAFFGLKFLKFLSLNRNLINVIRQQDFKELDKLEFLDLSQNEIMAIQPGSFSWMNSTLKTLKLNNNYLHDEIRNDIFSGLSLLNKLDISNNNLKCVFDFAFIDQIALKVLSLDFNKLTYISKFTFAGLKNLQVLSLVGNPLQVIEIYAFCHLVNSLQILNFTTNDPLQNESQKLLNNSTSMFYAKTIIHYNSKLVIPFQDTKLCSIPSHHTNHTFVHSFIQQRNNPDINIPWSFICPKAVPIYMKFNDDNSDYQITSNSMSQIYSLIVIAACVTFLLATCAMILSYKTWSKNQKCNRSSSLNFEGTSNSNTMEKQHLSGGNQTRTDVYKVTKVQVSDKRIYKSICVIKDDKNYSDNTTTNISNNTTKDFYLKSEQNDMKHLAVI